MRLIFDLEKNNLQLTKSRAGRFSCDEVSYDDGELQIYTCGLFLNAEDCQKEYNCASIAGLIKKIISDGKNAPEVLHGSYLLVVYNKQKNCLYVYNDLLSKCSVFYRYDEASRCLLISDSFLGIVNMSKEKILPCTIDELGVKMMMWHRMFYDDVTYIREIHFLRPYEFLECHDGRLERKTIARLPMLDVSIDEAAGEIHRLFSNAVRLQYEKNERNGYPQIATISGGMDSRSTFLYGLANGYSEQQGFCFGESTSTDYEYARNFAVKNGCQFFFHPIDLGNHILLRDELCEANEAQMVYAGTSGIYDSLAFYRTDKWGIVHTGLGGGEIMGDMRVADKLEGVDRLIETLKYRLGNGKKDRTWESFYSSLRCTDEDRSRIDLMKNNYQDFNEFQSLNDLRRCLNGQRIGKFYGVEFVSPFLNEDFFSYMLRIPFSMTKDRKLYIYWQKKYNPAQFSTPSTFQMGCSPGNKLCYYGKRLWKYAVNRMGRKTKHDMVPLEFWKAQNPLIEKKQQQLFNSDISTLKGSIDSGLTKILSDAWDRNAAPHENILTATWALRKITCFYYNN